MVQKNIFRFTSSYIFWPLSKLILRHEYYFKRTLHISNVHSLLRDSSSERLIDRLLMNTKDLKGPLVKRQKPMAAIIFPFPRHSTRWHVSFELYPGYHSLPISTISPRTPSSLYLWFLPKIIFYPRIWSSCDVETTITCASRQLTRARDQRAISSYCKRKR